MRAGSTGRRADEEPSRARIERHATVIDRALTVVARLPPGSTVRGGSCPKTCESQSPPGADRRAKSSTRVALMSCDHRGYPLTGLRAESLVSAGLVPDWRRSRVLQAPVTRSIWPSSCQLVVNEHKFEADCCGRLQSFFGLLAREPTPLRFTGRWRKRFRTLVLT